jgi:hypothetical protein
VSGGVVNPPLLITQTTGRLSVYGICNSQDAINCLDANKNHLYQYVLGPAEPLFPTTDTSIVKPGWCAEAAAAIKLLQSYGLEFDVDEDNEYMAYKA